MDPPTRMVLEEDLGLPLPMAGPHRDPEIKDGRDFRIRRSPAAALRRSRSMSSRGRRARIRPRAFLSRHSARAPWPG
ncbi:hypothetical protein GCM10022221_17660 [Actinocorallia aurea]